MEEIEEKINGIKLKENERGNDEIGSEKEETEKVSNRTMKLQKNKNKRDEKKKNKQNTKNKKEKSNHTINNKENDANDTIKETLNATEESEMIKYTEQKDMTKSNNNDANNIITDNAKKIENEKVILPAQVEYCKICTMPYEYCEYGKFYDECREENKDKYDYGIIDVVVDTDVKKKVKRPEKATNTKITIQKTSRAKKKVVTVVTGLHAYTKLDKMSKIFSKTFACGASVIKGTNNFPDHVDIQGDVGNSILEVIMKNCPEITEDKFVFLAPK